MQTKISEDTRFFGHPMGLLTLAGTEMWERMSYYGMRALLVIFMILALEEGGLGMTMAVASAIYGLYTGAVYFFGLPGGWIADRLIGGQKAVFYGGVIIMIGHIILAIPSQSSFFIGLIFVVLGTGLLKPNISAMVGELYERTDSRRDGAYTIYYMGINIGSLIGYGVCGYLQVNMDFHWAFGAAAVGMGLGLLQYKLTASNIVGISDKPVVALSSAAQKTAYMAILAFIILLSVVTTLIYKGVITFDPVIVAKMSLSLLQSFFYATFSISFLPVT